MRKICLFALLMLTVVVNAQKTASRTVSKSSVTAEKKSTKYEDVISKSGNVLTELSYKLPNLEIPYYYSSSTKVIFCFYIKKLVIGNISFTFLKIDHPGLNRTEALIEASNVKVLCNAIKEMKEKQQKPVPEGATAQYSYLGNEGVYIELSGDMWTIHLNGLGNDPIYIKDIDVLYNRLQEIIPKIDSIK